MVRVLGLLMMIGLGACGGGRQVNFPVDDSKVISTLSAAELQSMCDAMMDSAKYALDVACLSKGIAAKLKAGGTEQDCKTALDACRAEVATTTLACGLTQPGAVDGCNATVGEYELCLNDSLALAQQLQSKLSCSSSLTDLQNLATQLGTTPASCTTFKAKCPKGMGG